MKNYRATYFKHHNPITGIYICAYCGKPITKQYLTVDHIIPQKLFKRITTLLTLTSIAVTAYSIYTKNYSLMYTILPYAIGIQTILTLFKHSHLNLVASCRRCNSSKSDKLDLRIVRGALVATFGFPMAILISTLVLPFVLIKAIVMIIKSIH